MTNQKRIISYFNRMKKSLKILLIIIMATEVLLLYPQSVPTYKIRSIPTEKRVKDLLQRMTPEEKFWQLFCVAESWDMKKDRYLHGAFGFEGGEADGKAEGQMIALPDDGSAEGVVKKINEAQQFFIEKSRLGIPIIPFGEALHGLCREGATSFPQSIGLAATFDTSLMHRISKAIADETLGCGIRMVLSPVINIADDPRWGRTEETYGEDPWLSSAIGVAFVSEFEKSGIITCPKHFVANSGAGGRDSYPIHFNERLLEEIYFPPFKACIQKGGSRSVMAAYNSLDGTPCTANDWLLNKKLKKEWKFQGFVLSDAGATGGSNCLHMTAKDYYESTVRAMNNGLDVIFQTDFEHYKLFQPPFLDGSIKKEAIDKAVERVLRAKFQLGLFDQPYTDTLKAKSCFGKSDHIALALEAARKSIVLLKNAGKILPYSKGIKSVAVIGTDAVEARLGGYSGSGYQKVSILEGIKGKLANPAKVLYSPGCGRNSDEMQVIPGSSLSHDENGKWVPGLKGEYFNNPKLEGIPGLVRADSSMNFRWTLYSPDPKINYDWFSVRWTGVITFPETGDFYIGMEGNDGFRLYIDDELMIDNWRKGSFYGKMVEQLFTPSTSTPDPFSLRRRGEGDEVISGNSPELVNENRSKTLPWSYSHFITGKPYKIKIEFHETSGSVNLKLVWGRKGKQVWETAIEMAVEKAKRCENIIVVAGIEEGEGRDRAILSLPGRQEEMILRLAELNKPMVVVLVGGSAITMNRWIDKVKGIVDCWYPGEQGGNAVADVLFGDYNPAGRLPITFPISEGQLPLTYNHKPTGRNDDYGDLTGEALFPFGFGLSYANFEYSDLQIDKPVIHPNESVLVRMKITNSGTIGGEEVVQLYIKDLYASVTRPVKELKGCNRVFLKEGETKEISFLITPEMLSMLDEKLARVVEPGEFRILIGASSKDIRLRVSLMLKD